LRGRLCVGQVVVVKLGATTYVNDLDALPYLRIFPRGKFRIVVVPALVKGGARDLYCINHGCRECRH
jgi:hypothetical protein